MTATIDIALRAAGAFMLLTIAALLLRQAFDLKQARLGALMSAGLALVLIIDTPNAALIPSPARAVILLVSTNSALFIWWFLRSLLDDDFRFGRLEWAVAAAWVALVIPNYADFVAREPASNVFATSARGAIAAGIATHIVYIALSGMKSDLVEARRQVRSILAIAIAALFAVDVATEFFFGYLNFPAAYGAIEAAIWLLVISWSVSWLVRIDLAAIRFEARKPVEAPGAPNLTPREQLVHRELSRVMESERAYLDPDLSIGGLAERVGAPEHQLRALINTAMGHRNFRAFVNEYRLAAVKRDLADPQKAALPILTVAMDAGFASLSSFNRAFKDTTGNTPSEWREAALKARTADQN